MKLPLAAGESNGWQIFYFRRCRPPFKRSGPAPLGPSGAGPTGYRRRPKRSDLWAQLRMITRGTAGAGTAAPTGAAGAAGAAGSFAASFFLV